ncbi:MAG: PSD1 and planctomycete cytochrome C domain-containing protein [Limisphaerales bacterium]
MKPFATAVAAWLGLLPIFAAAPKPDFQREVRPILSRNCFACHGPDEHSRKSGLRLDLRDAALAPAKSGKRAVVPGKPEQSELVRRITSTDHNQVMPPPEAKKQLTPTEADTLRRWVASGADYQPHWAFSKPKQAPLPKVKQTSWPQNAIDHFVLARLEQAGLQPSPPADDYTLVRRLYLDLIGVPPTPEEADEFVKAVKLGNRQSAIGNLADKLLASPHYGERWARKWLDLARYADTNGYEKDRQRNIWPWRDWVIRVLNEDLPFDQFTIQQIAGDLLPRPALDSRPSTLDPFIATGFHRNTMLNEEGGIDPLEFRFYAMVDRVATTGTTWLGLTVGCAQCHTHKFDPIAHTEFYGLMAFLNNADEPDLDLPDAALATEHAKNLARAAQLLAEFPNKFPADAKATPPRSSAENLDHHFAAWLATERARAVAWKNLRPTEAKSNLPLLTVQPDDSVFASGDISKNDTYTLKFRAVPAGTTALRLEALPDDRLPAHGPGMTYYEGPKGDFFLGEFRVKAGSQPVKLARASQTYAKIWLGGDKSSAALAIDGNPETGWGVFERFGERHVAVFHFAEPLAAASDLEVQLQFGRHYACSLGRFRLAATSDAQATASDLPDEVVALLRMPEAELKAEQRAKLREHFLLVAPELKAARAEIEKLRKPPAHQTTLVLRERPPENPRPTFRHHRGEFLSPKEAVLPVVPAVLNPLPARAPRNRLGFAQWLVSPENPLTARVTVNRQWAAFFGQGLVRTTGDFGLQGDAPTHPELLDWLAVEFMRGSGDSGLGSGDSGRKPWSLKQLHRLIVTSATYQQSSASIRDSRAQPQTPDPRSQTLLSRFPRTRLDAELIRDSVLRASGLLSPKLGGPSVYPPQPASVTSEGVYGGRAWTESTGEDRYRRGLYTFAKRSAPYAMFNTFDGPSGEACIARREVSNTPLQALTLLNDTVILEAAQALGRQLAAQTGSIESRVESLFRRCVTRPPSADERAQLVKFCETLRARFASGELKAADFAGKGDGDANDRAAWTALARALLNLDELVTKS